MKPEYTMLAQKYTNQHIGGWWMSEKLDGMRCMWDGGITRGIPKSDVPWANTAKDNRYRIKPIATGLWSRLGNVIHAPDWWLDLLPKIPLDGELYSRLDRQMIFATIKDLVPGEGWNKIQYHVFDLLPLQMWLMDRKVAFRTLKGCKYDCNNLTYVPKQGVQFETVVTLMRNLLTENQVLKIHYQQKLPLPHDEAVAKLEEACSRIVEAGGEGVMLRKPESMWVPERTHNLLKYKPTDDAEGVVIGYTAGRETDKGSKLLGMMGALVLRLENGKEMELSGFTDVERELQVVDLDEREPARKWATEHPGERCPDWIEAIYFPHGTVVTFKYRGLSGYGIPQEARYFRKRETE